MGIRFACHHCNFSLHVKDFQGGKRGRCPECKGQFRIPSQDAPYSVDLIEVGSKGLDLPEEETVSHESDSVQVQTVGKSGAVKSAVPKLDSFQSPVPKTAPMSEMPGMAGALSDSLGAKWFVRPPTGGQYGPATWQLLMDWIKERRVTPDSLLWKEGTSDWVSASQLLPELYQEAMNTNPPIVTIPEALISTMGGTALASNEETKPSTASSQLLVKKRARKRKQQLTIVILLGLASVALLGTLVTVLVLQMNKS